MFFKGKMVRFLRSWLLCLLVLILAAAFAPFFAGPSSQNNVFSFVSVVLFAALSALVFELCARGLDAVSPRAALIAILSTAAICRAGWVLWNDNEQVSDFAIYHELAAAVAGGQGYTLTGPAGAEDLELYLGRDKTLPYTTAHRAPGVAFVGAALFKIAGPLDNAFKLLNLFLGVATAWLLTLLLSAWPAAARRAGLVWAIYPPAVMATSLYGSEILFTFLLCLAGLLFQRGRESDRLKYPAIGIVLAAAALTRSFLWPLVLSGVAAIIFTHGWKKGAFKAGFLIVCVFIALTPWIARNWSLLQRFVPICTNEGEFLAQRTKEFVPGRDEDAGWTERQAAWRAIINEADRAAEGYRIAADNWRRALAAGPLHTLHSLWRAAVSTFSNDYDMLFWSTRRSYYSVVYPGPTGSIKDVSLLIWRWFTHGFYIALLLGALTGVLLSARFGFDLVPNQFFLSFFFLLFATAHLFVMGQSRYHFPLMPVAAMLAGFARKK